MRGVSGGWVGTFAAERIAKPLQAEFWIGLPEGMNGRVAPVLPPAPAAPGAAPDPWAARLADPNSLAHKSWANPAVPPAAFNEYPFRGAEVPAGNGIVTARALSRVYAACLGEVDGVRLLEPTTLERATKTQAVGQYLLQCYEISF